MTAPLSVKSLGYVTPAFFALFTLAGCQAATPSTPGSASALLPAPAAVVSVSAQPASARRSWLNDIGPRYQWANNYGYCGEVSFISGGLYYGQYLSQYDARSAATNAPQYDYRSQLLLGGTDMRAARNMHLAATEWDRKTEKNPQQFLAWVKQNVVAGYPVAIGIYTNDYRFYGDHNPLAGSAAYDHIVPVIGIETRRPRPGYEPDDVIVFSDNGLLGSGPNHAQYIFKYRFGDFVRTRREANGPKVPWYSLPDRKQNFGAVITGVKDDDRETLPVRVATSVNDEMPQIAKHSNTRPEPDRLVLTVTVSGLKRGQNYVLYRYDALHSIPDGAFNAHASQASEHWTFEGTASGTYAITERIMTDDVAAYRAVREDAP
jgi:hypothetical protein